MPLAQSAKKRGPRFWGPRFIDYPGVICKTGTPKTGTPLIFPIFTILGLTFFPTLPIIVPSLHNDELGVHKHTHTHTNKYKRTLNSIP